MLGALAMPPGLAPPATLLPQGDVASMADAAVDALADAHWCGRVPSPSRRSKRVSAAMQCVCNSAKCSVTCWKWAAAWRSADAALATSLRNIATSRRSHSTMLSPPAPRRPPALARFPSCAAAFLSRSSSRKRSFRSHGLNARRGPGCALLARALSAPLQRRTRLASHRRQTRTAPPSASAP